MRKMMTKEVTSTIVKVAKIDMVGGLPQAVELEPVILLGNIDSEKAQKLVSKSHGAGVTVLSVEADTKVYQAPVTEFLKIATLKVDEETEQDSE
jgi:hypothetical protein